MPGLRGNRWAVKMGLDEDESSAPYLFMAGLRVFVFVSTLGHCLHSTFG